MRTARPPARVAMYAVPGGGSAMMGASCGAIVLSVGADRGLTATVKCGPRDGT
jgi:hypothetical protein